MSYMDTTECPLCFEYFPTDAIANHAAQCYGIVSRPENGECEDSQQAPNGAWQQHNKDRESNGYVMRKILYSAKHVFVHPSSHTRDHIDGELVVYKGDGGEVCIEWEPSYEDIVTEETALACGKAATEQLYALDVSVATLQSIRRHVPRMGFSHIVLQLRDGVTLAPLYFHNGYRDLKDFFECLSENVELNRQWDDPDLYLIPSASAAPHALPTTGEPSRGALSSASAYTVRDHAWNILERFSRVSRYARDNIGWGADAEEARPNARILDEREVQPRARLASGSDMDFELLSANDPSFGDSDGERRRGSGSPDFGRGPRCIVDPPSPLTVPERVPVSFDHWQSFLREDGSVSEPETAKAFIFSNGLEANARKEVWKFLLGYYPWGSTAAERERLGQAKELEYLSYKRQWQSITPAQETRFHKFRDRKHRIEKDVYRTDRHVAYYAGDDSPGLRMLHDILLTYSMFNFDLAYVQGMSDLLSPILYVMDGDEAAAFWCFAGFMDKVENNFQKDQSGIHAQLGRIRRLLEFTDRELFEYMESQNADSMIFCFRWVLILMKREFEFDDIMRLWEVLWTDHLSSNFLVFVCVGILHSHRAGIMEYELGLDGLLKYINDLEMTMDVPEVLARAQQLFTKCADREDLPDDLRPLFGLGRPTASRASSIVP